MAIGEKREVQRAANGKKERFNGEKRAVKRVAKREAKRVAKREEAVLRATAALPFLSGISSRNGAFQSVLTRCYSAVCKGGGSTGVKKINQGF